MARLTAKQRKQIPASEFAGPKGSFPIEDKAHIRAAVREEKFASPAEKAKINAAARRNGIDVGGDGQVFMPHHNATKV